MIQNYGKSNNTKEQEAMRGINEANRYWKSVKKDYRK